LSYWPLLAGRKNEKYGRKPLLEKNQQIRMPRRTEDAEIKDGEPRFEGYKAKPLLGNDCCLNFF
jgi:hypothetical protein